MMHVSYVHCTGRVLVMMLVGCVDESYGMLGAPDLLSMLACGFTLRLRN
jgi:hypothetical protein